MHYVIPWQPNIQLKKNALEIDCIIKYIENYIIVVEIHFDAYRKKNLYHYRLYAIPDVI